MLDRNFLNSPRLLELKRQRRRVFRSKIFIYIFSFLAIIALFVYISRAQNLNINSVDIVGNKVIDAETIREIVEGSINGNYLWLFPKTNVFLYPVNSIKKELFNKLKRIKNIAVSIKDKRVLEVTVTERIASYIWCGKVPPESQLSGEAENSQKTNDDTNQKCYFLDDDGYIFDEAAYFSEDVYFKLYGPANFVGNDPTGSNFLPETFAKLISLKESLKNIGLNPVAVYIPGNGEAKFFLSGETLKSMGPQIMINVDSDLQKIAENLETALDTEPLKSNIKNKYSSLLYIDLRFRNKVYYKFE